MADGNAPEAWIGQRVTFSTSGYRDFASGELTEVNDRGIVVRALRYEQGGETEGRSTRDAEDPHLLFVPWPSLERLLVMESDVGN